MKKLIYLMLGLFLIVGCSFNKDEETEVDNSNDMYVSFKVERSALEETNLPIVSIQTKDNVKILDKENWISATFKIENAENLNLDEMNISIKGRGNSTWSQSKKPYAIKLSSKEKILGMPKNKRWVLIANYMDNSFIKNEMAFFISRKIGMDYTVRGEYVNLILNDNYVGLYWLGEAIKVDKNRVNIDEENDYLLEMDISYDETWKFHSSKKKIPYMIKNDDYITDEKLDFLKSKISKIENILYDKNFPYTDETKRNYDTRYADFVDLDSFAQFYVVNEIMHNRELNNPKSCYFTFNTEKEYLKASAVWDYDWACETTSTKLFVNNSIYYDSLFKIADFNDKVNYYVSDLFITENDIVEQVESLRNKISKGVKLDEKRWGNGFRNPVGEKQANFDAYVDNVRDCIVSRLNYMKNADFKTKYTLEY